MHYHQRRPGTGHGRSAPVYSAALCTQAFCPVDQRHTPGLREAHRRTGSIRYRPVRNWIVQHRRLL